MPHKPSTHRPPRLDRLGLREHRPRRASAAVSGYDRRWERLARMFRRRHPLCADPFGIHAAEGRVVPGEQVDHIVPRSAGGTDDWSDLQTLCASCHSRKTALHDGGFGRPPTHRRGGGRQSLGSCAAGRTANDTRLFEGFAMGGVADDEGLNDG